MVYGGNMDFWVKCLPVIEFKSHASIKIVLINKCVRLALQRIINIPRKRFSLGAFYLISGVGGWRSFYFVR